MQLQPPVRAAQDLGQPGCAEQAFGHGQIAAAKRRADPGRGNPAPARNHLGRGMDGKAMAPPQCGKHLHVPCTAPAEPEIRPRHHRRDAKPAGQHPAREFHRRKPGKGGVEARREDEIHALPRQKPLLAVGRGQPERPILRPEEGARMRLAGHDGDRPPAGDLAGHRNQRPVAKVEAVEIPQHQHPAAQAVPRRQRLPDDDRPACGSGRRRAKRL
jgi:hypothetical protein